MTPPLAHIAGLPVEEALPALLPAALALTLATRQALTRARERLPRGQPGRPRAGTGAVRRPSARSGGGPSIRRR